MKELPEPSQCETPVQTGCCTPTSSAHSKQEQRFAELSHAMLTVNSCRLHAKDLDSGIDSPAQTFPMLHGQHQKPL